MSWSVFMAWVVVAMQIYFGTFELFAPRRVLKLIFGSTSGAATWNDGLVRNFGLYNCSWRRVWH